jgi:hypothetical protein
MKRAILCITLALSFAAPVGGYAKDKGERSGADAAAERARRDTGGRVLSVKPSPQQGEGDYRVKILTPQGEVRYMNVDPSKDRR